MVNKTRLEIFHYFDPNNKTIKIGNGLKSCVKKVSNFKIYQTV